MHMGQHICKQNSTIPPTVPFLHICSIYFHLHRNVPKFCNDLWIFSYILELTHQLKSVSTKGISSRFPPNDENQILVHFHSNSRAISETSSTNIRYVLGKISHCEYWKCYGSMSATMVWRRGKIFIFEPKNKLTA